MVTTAEIGEVDALKVTRADRVRAVLHTLGFTNLDTELIGGTYIGASQYISPERANNEPWILTYDPTTGEGLAHVEPTSPADYRAVVGSARAAYNSWRQIPAPKRGEVIRELGNAFCARKELLAHLITIEMGKILPESLGEVQEAIDICDFAVGLSRQLCGRTMHSERPLHRMYEQWHPRGPIGVITAFNFPVAVWAWNAAIAAVCGNTIVWKGSELTPLTSIAVQRICGEVMTKCGVTGVFNLITGGVELGRMMAHDDNLPLISFTGSCKAGREVSQIVAGRFGRCLLELGGNNAVIVTEDANFDLAMRSIVFSAFGTGGQRCTTTRRVIVQESVADELCERLVEACKQIKVGDPLEEGTLMGPLVSHRAAKMMGEVVAKAQAEGGKFICYAIFGQSPFVTPAIIRMPSQTTIVKKETFAPILYVMTYKTLDEAIAIQNDVPQGLSSAIFTESLKTAEKFLSATGSDCGIANVNIGTSGAEIGGAFGGEKATGGGREAGSDSWKAYMRRQTCTINYGDDLPLAQGITFDVAAPEKKSIARIINEQILDAVKLPPGKK